ncbi:hypothetical protein LTS10_005681 [Elasticomyces elasticus]|nr:hypothetical protein LTS10_005681 [Elasticomyces elasticus]
MQKHESTPEWARPAPSQGPATGVGSYHRSVQQDRRMLPLAETTAEAEVESERQISPARKEEIRLAVTPIQPSSQDQPSDRLRPHTLVHGQTEHGDATQSDVAPDIQDDVSSQEHLHAIIAPSPTTISENDGLPTSHPPSRVLNSVTIGFSKVVNTSAKIVPGKKDMKLQRSPAAAYENASELYPAPEQPCENEWKHDMLGAKCPECGSAFTEPFETEHDPKFDQTDAPDEVDGMDWNELPYQNDSIERRQRNTMLSTLRGKSSSKQNDIALEAHEESLKHSSAQRSVFSSDPQASIATGLSSPPPSRLSSYGQKLYLGRTGSQAVRSDELESSNYNEQSDEPIVPARESAAQTTASQSLKLTPSPDTELSRRGERPEEAEAYDGYSVAETTGMQLIEKYRLALAFAKDIKEGLALPMHSADGRVMIDEEEAESLLKAYCLMLYDRANTKLERKASLFVRKQRGLISTLLRGNFDPIADDVQGPRLPDYAPAISLQERMARWLGEQDLQMDGLVSMLRVTDDTQSNPSVVPEGSQKSDDLDDLLPSEASQVRDWLTTGVSWQWLQHRIARDVGGIPWPNAIVVPLLDRLGRSPTSGPEFRGYRLEFVVHWDPKRYLADFFQDVHLRTLSESIVLSGRGDSLQACTVQEYLRQCWPLLGVRLLHTLEAAIDSGANESLNGKSYTLFDRSTVSFDRCEEKLVVQICAQATVIIEVAEQLAWLGAACAASVYPDRPSYRKARYRNAGPALDPDSDRFEISYEDKEVDTAFYCWSSLFRNPSIACDFPARHREPGFPGLEMSVDMMIKLGDLLWATVFAEKFMLKGLSSMFYPVVREAHNVVWHFVCRKNKQVLPYEAAQDSCAGPDALAGMSTAWLHDARHFVGWTPHAASMLGTRDYPYSIPGQPCNLHKASNLTLERMTITGGKTLTAGLSIARGNHHRGMFLGEETNLRRMVYNARSMYTVLYDNFHKRGYLIDGASALLHLTYTQLKTPAREPITKYEVGDRLLYAGQDPYEGSAADILCDEYNLGIFLNKYVSQTTGKETLAENGHFIEQPPEREIRYYTVQDLVQDNYLVLSKLWELHANQRPGHDLRMTDRDRLEGWSLRSVVKGDAMLNPVIAHLQGSGEGWVDMIRSIKALVLMGTNIGEPITAVKATCPRWQKVPCGKDYLACRVQLLKEIAHDNNGDHTFPQRLLPNMRWHKESHMFEPCRGTPKHGGQCCERIQALYTSYASHCKSPTNAELQVSGAVVFGRPLRIDAPKAKKWWQLVSQRKTREDSPSLVQARNCSCSHTRGTATHTPASHVKKLKPVDTPVEATRPVPHVLPLQSAPGLLQPASSPFQHGSASSTRQPSYVESGYHTGHGSSGLNPGSISTRTTLSILPSRHNSLTYHTQSLSPPRDRSRYNSTPATSVTPPLGSAIDLRSPGFDAMKGWDQFATSSERHK